MPRIAAPCSRAAQSRGPSARTLPEAAQRQHQHDFRDFTNLRQRIAHGFLARAAAAYYSHRTAKALARDSRRERFRSSQT